MKSIWNWQCSAFVVHRLKMPPHPRFQRDKLLINNTQIQLHLSTGNALYCFVQDIFEHHAVNVAYVLEIMGL